MASETDIPIPLYPDGGGAGFGYDPFSGGMGIGYNGYDQNYGYGGYNYILNWFNDAQQPSYPWDAAVNSATTGNVAATPWGGTVFDNGYENLPIDPEGLGPGKQGGGETSIYDNLFGGGLNGGGMIPLPIDPLSAAAATILLNQGNIFGSGGGGSPSGPASEPTG